MNSCPAAKRGCDTDKSRLREILDPEEALQLAPAEARDFERAAIQILRHPFAAKRDGEQRGAERTANMRPALAPIEARIGETAAQRAQCGDVGVQRSEAAFAAARQIIIIGALRWVGQPAEFP